MDVDTFLSSDRVHLATCGTKYRGCDPLCPSRVSDLEERIKDLELEIAVDDQIMKEWARVLDAIPPCRAHGSRCVPHALDWIAEMTSPRKAV